MNAAPAAEPAGGAPDEDIVLVDDDPLIAEFVKRMLRGSGRRLRAFTDPLAALDHLLARTARVLIVDTRMPGLSGPALIARLADGDRLAGTRTILCSADHRIALPDAPSGGAEVGGAAGSPGIERLDKSVLYDRRTFLERLDATAAQAAAPVGA